ncbi:hypothetical protein ACSW29_06200 [Rhodococcus sp. GB-02]
MNNTSRFSSVPVLDRFCVIVIRRGTSPLDRRARLRRRELTPEQNIAETTQREQRATAKDMGQPEAKERNNRAMMLARQREHTDQQKHRGRDIER